MHVLRRMRQLANQNLGVIMTTHNPDHAFLCCDRVILITRDRRVVEGNVDEVVTEENLYQAYGVHVKIMEQQLNNGMKIKSCVPAIDS